MHPQHLGSRFALASFGELVGDPSRAAMLLSLLDGLARPASELAGIAGVGPSTASAHLGRLLTGGLVTADRRGRHRYFRLANDEVAEALETLARPLRPPARTATNPHRAAFAHSRTCYRHLAGRLGVAWLGALERDRLVTMREGAVVITPRGARRLDALGLGVGAWPDGKACLDWTERKNHLGGPLGGALTDRLFTLGWIERAREPRVVRATTRGRRALAEVGIARDLLG